MATITSHTLNGVDGTHAGGIGVTLLQITTDGARKVMFSSETDAGGRLREEVDLDGNGPDTVYELTFSTGAFWSARDLPRQEPQIMSEIVFRFTMPNANEGYHIPVIFSPNAYSAWWSS